MEFHEMPREVHDASFFNKSPLSIQHTASFEWEKTDLENSEY
jgi:hypothetical protein